MCFGVSVHLSSVDKRFSSAGATRDSGIQLAPRLPEPELKRILRQAPSRLRASEGKPEAPASGATPGGRASEDDHAAADHGGRVAVARVRRLRAGPRVQAQGRAGRSGGRARAQQGRACEGQIFYGTETPACLRRVCKSARRDSRWRIAPPVRTGVVWWGRRSGGATRSAAAVRRSRCRGRATRPSRAAPVRQEWPDLACRKANAGGHLADLSPEQHSCSAAWLASKSSRRPSLEAIPRGTLLARTGCNRQDEQINRTAANQGARFR